LTIATSVAPTKIDALDFARLNSVVDSYNIMSYDMTSGSWGDAFTGHQAANYMNPADPIALRKTWSAAYAASYMVSKGALANKINLGAALYGRGF
jgi:GH18 family chitinase